MVRASASEAGGRGFDPEPSHIKDVKMVPVATLLGAQHYKANTSFSSPKETSMIGLCAHLPRMSARAYGSI